MTFKRLSMVLSMLSILALSTGCSSMGSVYDHPPSFLEDLERGGSSRSTRPWHPPDGFSYGDRIPNMKGDYKRFCTYPDNWKCG